jgi:hypothetical protein
MPSGHDDGPVHPPGGGPRTHAVEVGGLTGAELLDRLERAGVRLNDGARTRTTEAITGGMSVSGPCRS